MKLKITATRAFTYRGQHNPQDRFFEISADGMVEVDVNTEIGNAVPSTSGNGVLLRISIPNSMTRKQIINFYRDNRADFLAVVDGFSVQWDGSNNVGRLTDDARAAMERLEYAVYSWS